MIRLTKIRQHVLTLLQNVAMHNGSSLISGNTIQVITTHPDGHKLRLTLYRYFDDGPDAISHDMEHIYCKVDLYYIEAQKFDTVCRLKFTHTEFPPAHFEMYYEALQNDTLQSVEVVLRDITNFSNEEIN